MKGGQHTNQGSFKGFDLRSENKVWGRNVAQRKKNLKQGFSSLALIVTDR